MTLGQRIRSLRQARKLTLQQVADVFGITRASVAGWERGSSRPDQDKLVRLAKLLGTNVEWLLNGSSAAARRPDANIEAGPHLAGLVPLISWVQAGDWGQVVDNLAPGDAEAWLPCPRRASAATFALRVRGISMEPRFQDGDIIFVDPDVPPAHGRNVVVRLDADGEATFKQLVVEGGAMFLRALNPDWPGPKLIRVDADATFCGVVIGKWVPE